MILNPARTQAITIDNQFSDLLFSPYRSVNCVSYMAHYIDST